MVRILSIWLPQLPLDRLVRAGDPRTDGPFAITQESRNATRLSHLSPAAVRAGLASGLSLPDARAICPDLLTEPADPVREAVLLRSLWRWADQLSPRIALDAPDGLLLDITGCAHLFGGEEAMARHARTRLADLEIASCLGLADTKRAARALSRFGDGPIAIAPAGKTRAHLAPLPIAALGLDAGTTIALSRAGLQTIGQLYPIASRELARRYGLALTGALDAASGLAPDPVTPAASDPVYAASMSLPEPIGFLHDLEQVLHRLASSVCDHLKEKNKGARRFNLIIRCVDTGDHLLSVGFARPCLDVAQIMQQFSKPLADLKISFGADWFRLHALHTEPIRTKQIGLESASSSPDDIDHLITTLGNRIGFDRVRCFSLKNSHLPDCAFDQREAIDQHTIKPWRTPRRKRPVSLFPMPEYVRSLEPGRPPVSFEWRRRAFKTASARGPERLTPEWWRASDKRVRDYWHVDTEQGPRLWLLTYPADMNRSAPTTHKDQLKPSGDAQWYVAGTFP